MSDPRSANTRLFTTDNSGKVTGVTLTYIPVAASKWELIKAELIDEISAQGNTIARVIVKDKDGIDTQIPCYLGFPWKDGTSVAFENKLLPGSLNYPYEHVITNGYEAPNRQGPLAIYIGDQQGNVNSDVIAGLGLPNKHHISFHLVFRERGTPVVPPPLPDDPMNQILTRLKKLEDSVAQLLAHIGLSS